MWGSLPPHYSSRCCTTNPSCEMVIGLVLALRVHQLFLAILSQAILAPPNCSMPSHLVSTCHLKTASFVATLLTSSAASLAIPSALYCSISAPQKGVESMQDPPLCHKRKTPEWKTRLSFSLLYPCSFTPPCEAAVILRCDALPKSHLTQFSFPFIFRYG